MEALSTLPHTALLDYLHQLEARLSQTEYRVQETELFVYDLADEFGSRLAENREVIRHRSLLESLLVEAYRLSSSEALYWKSDYGMRRELQFPRFFTDTKYDQRAAQVMLYYILFTHTAGASLKGLEAVYGYSRRHTMATMGRLEQNTRHQGIRQQVERAFLDAIGRRQEPVSIYNPDNQLQIAHLKEACRQDGVSYLRSMLHDDPH